METGTSVRAEGSVATNGSSKRLQLFIDGAFVDAVSGKTFANISPVDGSLVADVAEAAAEDVDRAVRAARRALTGPWRTMSLNARLDLLARVSDRIMERFDEFLDAEMADTG